MIKMYYIDCIKKMTLCIKKMTLFCINNFMKGMGYYV